MTIDIDSADGDETLNFARDPERPGYVVIAIEAYDGELPAIEMGSYRILDLIRILDGLRS